MKKLVDFNNGYETQKRVITSAEEFEILKAEFPNSDFADLNDYPNYRKPFKRSSIPYIFNINNCKAACEIVCETEKAYKLQVSHISGYTNGNADSRHFKWVAKSLVKVIDGIAYYPYWI